MKRLFALLVLIVVSAAAKAEAPVILVFGDSLSAGYGLERVDQGWVELLKTRLKSEGYGYQVINASVSGETTAGGLARLPRALELHHPNIVILELGGNDGLRALPVVQMRENFNHMIDLATRAGVEGERFHVQTPLIMMTKAEIIRRGIALGLDYSLTHSCYAPLPSGRPCERCDSCVLRARGFAAAGVPDPLLARP